MQPRREAGVAFTLSFELVALNLPDRMGLHSLCLAKERKKTLNLEKGELRDPDELADDVSMRGHWGNGDYRIYLSDDEKFDYVLGLIRQSFDAQQ